MELAGRKERRRTWDGLGEEMTHVGWFDGDEVKETSACPGGRRS